jgi:hypothetical protein
MSKTDPLENPDITAKLAKLQSELLDHLEKKKAEGKKRERVRVTPRKPGPRTEEEKRKFYRARRLQPKAISQTEFFTLDQAAVRLGYKAEKSVRRLISAGKLEAQPCVHDGKKHLMISRADLNRYVIIAERRVPYGAIPTMQQGDLGGVVFYGPWHEKASARLARYTLTVTIEEFWEFACKPYESESDYESIKTALRKRIRDAPADFQVRYLFDSRALTTLKRIIGFTWKKEPYSLKGLSRSELFAEALSHLQLKVLPNLRRAKRHWVAYLYQSVLNFFKDKARQDNRLFAHINASVDVDRLTELNNISDPIEHSIARRANMRARKRKPAE